MTIPPQSILTLPTMIQKSVVILGDGKSSDFLVHHNMGTKDVIVQVWDTGTGVDLGFNVMTTQLTANTLRIDCIHTENMQDWVPKSGQLTVVVLA